MDTDAVIQPPIAGVVTLYFTRPWVPDLRERLKLWIGALGYGLPSHVVAAVDGMAFGIGPGANCFQIDQRAYEVILEGNNAIIDTLCITVPNGKGAADAAWTYAVGPMTNRQAFIRWVTGHERRDDIDCVLAAVKVLRGGGLDVPSFRTPKRLYKWLKAKHDSKT